MQDADYKRCTKCDVAQPLEAFASEKRMADGRASACKACKAAYDREYRARPERRVAKRAESRAFYQRHRESKAAYAKAYRLAHPELYATASREYRDRNLELVRERSLQHYHKNLKQARERGRQNMLARKLGRGATELAYADVLAGDPCSYCGAPVEAIDHIAPLSRGGANAWDNLTAACGSCNSSKHAKPLLHFLLRRGT